MKNNSSVRRLKMLLAIVGQSNLYEDKVCFFKFCLCFLQLTSYLYFIYTAITLKLRLTIRNHNVWSTCPAIPLHHTFTWDNHTFIANQLVSVSLVYVTHSWKIQDGGTHKIRSRNYRCLQLRNFTFFNILPFLLMSSSDILTSCATSAGSLVISLSLRVTFLSWTRRKKFWNDTRKYRDVQAILRSYRNRIKNQVIGNNSTNLW